METALLVALIVVNIAWLVARELEGRRADTREAKYLNQLSEMATRIQHPQVMNPRVFQEPAEAPVDLGPDEREFAGQIFGGGLDERDRLQVEE